VSLAPPEGNSAAAAEAAESTAVAAVAVDDEGGEGAFLLAEGEEAVELVIEGAVRARSANPGRRKATALVAEPSPAAVLLALWPPGHSHIGVDQRHSRFFRWRLQPSAYAHNT
jgi:hypothetical protein